MHIVISVTVVMVVTLVTNPHYMYEVLRTPKKDVYTKL